jgi:hypothetical protein
MSDVLTKIIAFVAIVVGVVALMFVAIAANAFVLSMLWAWYVVPVFGMPALSLPVAFGLGLIASCFHRSYTPHIPKDQQFQAFVSALAYPFILLTFGWLGTFFL